MIHKWWAGDCGDLTNSYRAIFHFCQPYLCNPATLAYQNQPTPTSQKKQLRARNADHWFLTTSDRGSNEVMARKYFASLVMNCDNVFFLEADCLEHQAHLICLAGLSFVDQSFQSPSHGSIIPLWLLPQMFSEHRQKRYIYNGACCSDQ